MLFESLSHADGSEGVLTKRRPWMLRLNLVAAAIALGILALSVQGLWNERKEAWNSARQASRNLLTTLTRDLSGDIAAVDLSLERVIQGLRYQRFDKLPPEVQHGMLFDRAGVAHLATTVILADETGRLIADGGPVLAPRDLNVSDADFFKVHKEQSFLGLYISHPYESRIRAGSFSIALSRRISHPDGAFAGVVATEIALSDIDDLFQDLNLSPRDSITLFRYDGTVLMRRPYDQRDVGRNLGDTPNFQRFRQEGSGSFEGRAAIDHVRRLYTFSRVDDQPLILTVALSVDNILAPWWRRALVLAGVTGVLCAAVVRLTFLFQRELGRRTRAEEALERLSHTDALTGLANRRAFDKAFDREWRQAICLGSPLSLLFIDVDHFKRYNDEYGHAKGDDVLRAVAHAIEGAIRRPHDFAARYGGEEFTVVLPETEQSDAEVFAQEIRKAVARLCIEHRRSSFDIVTISIGAATMSPTQGDNALSLLKAADAALYEAKAAGRNRVCRPRRGSENAAM
jgi:diguanylate cyclase (GGDEF)-like protein